MVSVMWRWRTLQKGTLCCSKMWRPSFELRKIQPTSCVKVMRGFEWNFKTWFSNSYRNSKHCPAKGLPLGRRKWSWRRRCCKSRAGAAMKTTSSSICQKCEVLWSVVAAVIPIRGYCDLEQPGRSQQMQLFLKIKLQWQHLLNAAVSCSSIKMQEPWPRKASVRSPQEPCSSVYDSETTMLKWSVLPLAWREQACDFWAASYARGTFLKDRFF